MSRQSLASILAWRRWKALPRLDNEPSGRYLVLSAEAEEAENDSWCDECLGLPSGDSAECPKCSRLLEL